MKATFLGQRMFKPIGLYTFALSSSIVCRSCRISCRTTERQQAYDIRNAHTYLIVMRTED